MAISDQNEVFVDDPAKVFDRGPFVGVDPQFQHSYPDVGIEVDDLHPDPAVEIREEQKAEGENSGADAEDGGNADGGKKAPGVDGTEQGADGGATPPVTPVPQVTPAPAPAPKVAPAPAPAPPK